MIIKRKYIDDYLKVKVYLVILYCCFSFSGKEPPCKMKISIDDYHIFE